MRQRPKSTPEAVRQFGSGSAKNRVRSDPPPDDVRLAGLNLDTVGKGRTTVRRPRQLPHTRMVLNALDAQPRAKSLAGAGQVSDELGDGLPEDSLLLWRQPIPVAPE
jgi:hypothetical protein